MLVRLGVYWGWRRARVTQPMWVLRYWKLDSLRWFMPVTLTCSTWNSPCSGPGYYLLRHNDSFLGSKICQPLRLVTISDVIGGVRVFTKIWIRVESKTGKLIYCRIKQISGFHYCRKVYSYFKYLIYFNDINIITKVIKTNKTNMY